METKQESLLGFIKGLFFAWVIFFVLALTIFVYIILIRHELFKTTSNALALTFLGSFALGSLSFIACIFLYVFNEQVKNKEKPKQFLAFIKTFLLMLIFPIYFVIKMFISFRVSKPKLIDKRIGFLLGTIFIILPFWLLGYLLVFMGLTRVAGLRHYMSSLSAGGQSMAPTLEKGTSFKLYPYKNILYKLSPNYAYKFQHGDIVSFSNTVTKQLISDNGLSDYNFVKRIVALPGDTIELKGGIVYLNGKPLDEPYTLTPNSTFPYQKSFQGKVYGNFLSECEALTIPNNKLFVLADNRENGDDSRFIGLVDFSDVDGYLPLKDQTQGYMEGSNFINHSSKWRQPNTTLVTEALNKANSACK